MSHPKAREPSPISSRALARLSIRVALLSLAAAAAILASASATAAGGAVSAAAGCDITQTKSLVGTAPTKITFVNNTSTAVKLYWLSYAGVRVYYATIEPGKSFVQATFDTHPWVIVNGAGACIGYVIAPRAVFEIGAKAKPKPKPKPKPAPKPTPHLKRPARKHHLARPRSKPVPKKHVVPPHRKPAPHLPPAPSPRHRSAIAAALVPPRHAFPLSARTLLNALLALGLVLFIIFPAQVFNRTLDENHEEIAEILRRRLRFLSRLRRPKAVSKRTGRWFGFALVVVAGSILGGLNDPGFGVNALGERTLAAVVLAFLVGVGVSSAVSAAYRRLKGIPLDGYLHALPAGLLIGAACVLVSRLSHFEPGYLYGVVAGVAFATELADNDQGIELAAGTLTTLAVATAAWIAWVPVSVSASHPDASTLTLIADTFLASIFVGGIVGTVINLLPLRFLPGGTIVDWNRLAWGAIAALALFVLLEVMIFPAHHPAHSSKTPLATTVALFVVFAAFSLLFRQYFAIRNRKKSEEPESLGVSVEAEEVTEVEQSER